MGAGKVDEVGREKVALPEEDATYYWPRKLNLFGDRVGLYLDLYDS